MALMRDLLAAHSNDYSPLERAYKNVAGVDLVTNPYAAPVGRAINLTMSMSVVIPAWNAAATIEPCLRAIEMSSFNRCHPQLLEVLVVDDGSVDGTWDRIAGVDFDLNLVVLRQAHHSRSHAMNAGIAAAKGQTIVSCDADIVLSVFSLEEFAKRCEILGDVVLVGFRHDVDSADSRFASDGLRQHLPLHAPVFATDNRVSVDRLGWPENMCVASGWFRELGAGRKLWATEAMDPMGDSWDLPRMVYGALFAAPRTLFERIGGFDERFVGWGWEDTAIGASAVATGLFIIPVPSAVGFHLSHAERSVTQWQEAALNARRFNDLVDGPFQVLSNGLATALARVERRVLRRSAGKPKGVPQHWFDALKRQLSGPLARAEYWASVGDFERVCVECRSVQNREDERGRSRLLEGEALRFNGHLEASCDALREAAALISSSAKPLVQLALSLSARGEFGRAATTLREALDRPVVDSLGEYLWKCSTTGHLERARRYYSDGRPTLARRDFEAVLLRSGTERQIYQEWERSASAAACG